MLVVLLSSPPAATPSEAVGGFERRLVVYGYEDPSFCMRSGSWLRTAGWCPRPT